MIGALDPGLRHCGFTVATLQGVAVDAWLPRSKVRSHQSGGERIPAENGPVAWRGMVSAIYLDLRERGHLERITVLVVEWPEIYREEKKGKKLRKVNPNDLLELAAVDGGLACALPRLERYERFTPRQWKKQYRKKNYQDQILEELSPEELALLEQTPESLRHNVIESLGLARFTASVLAGAPISVPALQGRARPSAPTRTSPAPAPAYRSPAPATAPTFGQRHFPGGLPPRAPRADLAKLATSASYPPGRKP